MSTQENGISTNILGNLPLQVNIVSSTNASPIVMTTAIHGMTNGDAVTINEHAGNTAANGSWIAAVLSSTTFQLVGSTGNGVGGATGTAQPLALGPTFAIPSDTVDNLAAASVNTPFEALADRTAFLGTIQGGYKIVQIGEIDNDDPHLNIWDSFTPTVINTWTASNSGVTINPFTLTVTNVHAGDIVEVFWNFNQHLTATGTTIVTETSLWYAVKPPGGATPSYQQVQGSSRVAYCFDGDIDYSALSCGGQLTVAGLGGELQLQLRGWTTTPVGDVTSWTLEGDYQVRGKIYRGTGMPQ